MSQSPTRLTNRTRPRPKMPPSSVWGWGYIIFGILFGSGFPLTIITSLIYSLFELFTTPDVDLMSALLLLLINIPGVCVTLPFAIVSGLFIYWGVQHLKNDKSLKTHGQIIQATITDKWVRHYKGTKCYVAYEFQAWAPDGAFAHYQHAERNRTAYKHYEIGDTVPLCYVPHTPTICRLELDTT